MNVVLIVFFSIVAIVILWGVGVYNRIVKSENSVDKAFGSVDAMLKKRYDLIPNLVETVKAYMTHEADTFTEITRLRTNAGSSKRTSEKVEKYNEIEKKMRDVMFNVENYPNLKASQNFLSLQASWNITEENIAAARRYYNSAVTYYNNSIETFPALIIARMFDKKEARVFEIPHQQRHNIDAAKMFNR
ncbi:MAG: LemA family protein [Bacteroidales bacterium]